MLIAALDSTAVTASACIADIENGMRHLVRERLMESNERRAGISRWLQSAIREKQTDRRHRISLYAAKLKGASPLEKLANGYSYVADENGKNIRDVTLLEKGDRINIYMLNGKVKADVREIKKTEH